jgi:hypothetical protein
VPEARLGPGRLELPIREVLLEDGQRLRPLFLGEQLQGKSSGFRSGPVEYPQRKPQQACERRLISASGLAVRKESATKRMSLSVDAGASKSVGNGPNETNGTPSHRS